MVAADSLGVRSMATLVEVGGLRIFIDPGASLAPRRYGLPPHPVELEALEEALKEIVRVMDSVDVVVITHYHYDHYLYRQEQVDAYNDKILVVKHPTEMINHSQMMRARRLLRQLGVESRARSIHYADGRVYDLGDVVLEFSRPVPHGPEGTRLGYLVMVRVYDRLSGECFVHASDVQGPMEESTLSLIVSWRPSVVFISGPPTYFAGYKVPAEDVERGVECLKKLASTGALVIADHHLARDREYLSMLRELRRETGGRLVSAAEFMGVEPRLLESMRRELWRGHG